MSPLRCFSLYVIQYFVATFSLNIEPGIREDHLVLLC